MKKSKKKVASTMDERARLISAESAAGGYWVAMLGIFVTILVTGKTHSLELAQSLLYITFFGSMCVVVAHSVSRNGHPFLLDKKIEKKILIFSWVMLLGGAFVSLLILVQSFRFPHHGHKERRHQARCALRVPQCAQKRSYRTGSRRG